MEATVSQISRLRFFCQLFRQFGKNKVYGSMKYLRDFTGLALNPFLNPVQHLGRNLKSWLHAQPSRSDSSSSDVFFMRPSWPRHMCSSPSGARGWCAEPTAPRAHTRLQNQLRKCSKSALDRHHYPAQTQTNKQNLRGGGNYISINYSCS